MLDSFEELLSLGHLGKIAVEVPSIGQPLPELASSVPLLECLRTHSEKTLGPGVEVREHSVAVKEEMRFLRHHLNFAGSIRIGMGRSRYCQPRSRRRSLLSFAFRPEPSDQVI